MSLPIEDIPIGSLITLDNLESKDLYLHIPWGKYTSSKRPMNLISLTGYKPGRICWTSKFWPCTIHGNCHPVALIEILNMLEHLERKQT